ncbi:hypothetical protein [Microvirga sp. P5_D2]
MAETAKFLTLEMSNGEVWGIPLEVIARDRAENYKDEFDNDVERSLAEDTLPLFEDDPWNAQDWAANNMNWSDVAEYAVKLKEAPAINLAREWNTASMSVEAVPAPLTARR